jgi:hypothetical protein
MDSVILASLMIFRTKCNRIIMRMMNDSFDGRKPHSAFSTARFTNGFVQIVHAFHRPKGALRGR